MKKINFFILSLLLGFLSAFLFNILQNGFKYYSFKDFYHVSFEIDNIRSEIENLTVKKHQLEEDLFKNINTRRDENLSYIGLLNDEIKALKDAAGYTALEGEGVVIMISDGTRELLHDEDPNNLIVHDIDLAEMIEDLRYAGAEAISINGQRILYGQSEIKCIGPTILINDKVYTTPFIINAIGDKNYLMSAVNAPGNFGYQLKSWGLIVEVNTSVSVSVPAYVDL